MRFLFIVLILFTYSAYSQKFQFTEPIRLSTQINSNAEEISPILSPDGKTLYFSRALDPNNIGGEMGGTDIWIAKKNSTGEWQKATNNAYSWNNKYNNAVIGIDKSGTVVYLLNAYERGSGISFSKLVNGNWSEPERISIPGINQNDLAGCYMNSNFDVLLLSMNNKKSLGQEDLFVSLKDSLGSWNTPINLGSTINSVGFEITPFLAEDGRRLYFSSDGHKGFGDADIFYSDRLYNSWETWSTPISLGNKINSSDFEASFSMYGDSLSFFSSNRNSELAEIYSVKAILKSQEFDSERQYLTDAEVAELIGNTVYGELQFDRSSTALNTAQNELLFYIVNKIITRSDINIQLSVGENEKEEIGEERLIAVSEKLRLLGISSYRIFQVKVTPAINRTSNNGKVLLTFFR